MKICVSSYSFNKLLKSGEMDQLSAMKKAKELGFDGMEFSEILAPEGKTKQEFATLLKSEADKLDFPIVSFVFGADLANGKKRKKCRRRNCIR